MFSKKKVWGKNKEKKENMIKKAFSLFNWKENGRKKLFL